MDIGVVLGVFIAWPFLALIPAALFAFIFVRSRRPVTVVAALAWLAYLPYEYAMKLRILCSGECNIRVDLLLIYPFLFILSALAVAAFFRRKRELNQKTEQ
jgi:hypothetical protein